MTNKNESSNRGTMWLKFLVLIVNSLLWVTYGCTLFLLVFFCLNIYYSFVSNVYYPLIVTFAIMSAVVIAVSHCSYCCTFKNRRALLSVYAAILGMDVVLKLAMLLYFYKRTVEEDGVQDFIDYSMKEYYNEDETYTANIFDFIQQILHCCGKQGPKDWLDLYATRPIPQSCCAVGTAMSCDTSLEKIFQKGCLTPAMDFVFHDALVPVLLIFIVMPLIGILLSCQLARKISTKSELVEA